LRALLRRADVIHVHTVKGMLRALRTTPWRYCRKSVSTFHNPHQRATLLLLAARRVVALNSRDAGRLARLNPLARPSVVRNGLVGSRRLSPAESVEPEQLPARSIVFVGALHRRKGLDVLLRSVAILRAEVPDVRLYIVGNRDAEEFEKLAVDLGIADCTSFAGFRPDPRSFMRAAGVFVLPSRDEGFGNVLPEARSVGAPIVASDVGGIREALDGGRAGMLVPPEDPAALARALTAVLTDEATRIDLVRRSRTGLEGISVGRFRDDYREVYCSL
jgi:glycosyltransferase involved in cell wall biosynthesis